MLLFHVSSGITQSTQKHKLFYPRIPLIKSCTENNTMGRICFSTDIRKCLLAMPDGEDSVFEKNEVQKRTGVPSIFDVYILNTNTISESNILSPIDLYNLNYVNDALENDEYWVIDTKLKLPVSKTVRVKDISVDNIEERGNSFEDFLIEEPIQPFDRTEKYIFPSKKHLTSFEKLLLKEHIAILNEEVIDGCFIITFKVPGGTDITKVWKFYYFTESIYSSKQYNQVTEAYKSLKNIR